MTIPMRDHDKFWSDLGMRNYYIERLLTEGVWDQQGWDMIGRPVAYEPVGKGYAAAPGQQVPDYFLAPFPDAKVEGVTGGQDLNIGQTLLNSVTFGHEPEWTKPATSPGYAWANMNVIAAPADCPTRKYGGSIPAAMKRSPGPIACWRFTSRTATSASGRRSR